MIVDQLFDDNGPESWARALAALVLDDRCAWLVLVSDGRPEVLDWLESPAAPAQVREALESALVRGLSALWGSVRLYHGHQTEIRAPYLADDFSVSLATGLPWPPPNVQFVISDECAWRRFVDGGTDSLPSGVRPAFSIDLPPAASAVEVADGQ